METRNYTINIEIDKEDWSNLEFEERRENENNGVWQYKGKLYINNKYISYEEGGSEAYIIQEFCDRIYNEIIG